MPSPTSQSTEVTTESTIAHHSRQRLDFQKRHDIIMFATVFIVNVTLMGLLGMSASESRYGDMHKVLMGEDAEPWYLDAPLPLEEDDNEEDPGWVQLRSPAAVGFRLFRSRFLELLMASDCIGQSPNIPRHYRHMLLRYIKQFGPNDSLYHIRDSVNEKSHPHPEPAAFWSTCLDDNKDDVDIKHFEDESIKRYLWKYGDCVKKGRLDMADFDWQHIVSDLVQLMNEMKAESDDHLWTAHHVALTMLAWAWAARGLILEHGTRVKWEEMRKVRTELGEMDVTEGDDGSAVGGDVRGHVGSDSNSDDESGEESSEDGDNETEEESESEEEETDVEDSEWEDIDEAKEQEMAIRLRVAAAWMKQDSPWLNEIDHTVNCNYAAMLNPRQEENEDDWEDYEGDDGDRNEEWDDDTNWEDCDEEEDDEEEQEEEEEEEADEREIKMNIRIVVAWLSHEYPWLNGVE